MRAAIKISLCLLVAAVLVALIAGAIVKTREAAARTHCTNNLKQLGLGLHLYHHDHKQFPTGTLANPDLAPEKRFSWLVEICPGYLGSYPRFDIDKKKAWDAPENSPPRWQRDRLREFPRIQEEFVDGVLDFAICPANLWKYDPALPSVTSYLGATGVRADSAELPLENVNAGIFGYERKVRISDCKHGMETTIMLVESLDGGPWTAGGQATLRGFERKRMPYFGTGGQFASNHSVGSNVVMADGSVRFFTSAMSPRVIEAMAALAGDKDLARFED